MCSLTRYGDHFEMYTYKKLSCHFLKKNHLGRSKIHRYLHKYLSHEKKNSNASRELLGGQECGKMGPQETPSCAHGTSMLSGGIMGQPEALTKQVERTSISHMGSTVK